MNDVVPDQAFDAPEPDGSRLLVTVAGHLRRDGHGHVVGSMIGREGTVARTSREKGMRR
ncbi:hypothetical protein ABZ434_20220 [Streptomyces sp. NPDC005761]